METKKTKATAKTGENKPTNIELLRQMVNVSNNSRLTNQIAIMLSQKLEKKDMSELLEWFRHANREISIKLSQGKRF